METKLIPSHKAPDFDAKIAEWIAAFPVDPDDWGGTMKRVAIVDKTGGNRVIYRRIDADGMQELIALLEFLHSIGLVDQHVESQFDSIYGLPD